MQSSLAPVLILVGALAVACSSSGETTTAANIDAPCGASGSATCTGGTQCLAKSRWFSPAGDAGAGCTASTQTCSITCTKDADCTPFGATVKCIQGCNLGPSTCGDPNK